MACASTGGIPAVSLSPGIHRGREQQRSAKDTQIVVEELWNTYHMKQSITVFSSPTFFHTHPYLPFVPPPIQKKMKRSSRKGLFSVLVALTVMIFLSFSTVSAWHSEGIPTTLAIRKDASTTSFSSSSSSSSSNQTAVFSERLSFLCLSFVHFL